METIRAIFDCRIPWVSIASFAVAAAAGWVAWLQHKTAQNNLRLAVFAKAFPYFGAAWEAYAFAMSPEFKSDNFVRYDMRLIRAREQAQFLFRSPEIETTFNAIRNHIYELKGKKESAGDGETDHKNRMDQLKLISTLENELRSLADLFRRYLKMPIGL